MTIRNLFTAAKSFLGSKPKPDAVAPAEPVAEQVTPPETKPAPIDPAIQSPPVARAAVLSVEIAPGFSVGIGAPMSISNAPAKIIDNRPPIKETGPQDYTQDARQRRRREALREAKLEMERAVAAGEKEKARTALSEQARILDELFYANQLGLAEIRYRHTVEAAFGRSPHNPERPLWQFVVIGKIKSALTPSLTGPSFDQANASKQAQDIREELVRVCEEEHRLPAHATKAITDNQRDQLMLLDTLHKMGAMTVQEADLYKTQFQNVRAAHLKEQGVELGLNRDREPDAPGRTGGRQRTHQHGRGR